ncbi:hypothetical protein RBH26_21105 [Natronolimnohabitans sp. A-GB9]|uniref:hypothetical protein n=1 Tax=Natronolimnohabitans sp. A-GB9 TaxID=3069757 RepID=UPI0027B5449D|nr:hypothetical protein [Natronolimnohabitans sp. A-GB9]MDQ2052944.1 hypothetical protein [Natronolimnohabitans sp. A-GB9]
MACADGDLMRHPGNSDRLIAIDAIDDLDVLELLTERLERVDRSNEILLASVADRRQRLRNGGDS